MNERQWILHNYVLQMTNEIATIFLHTYMVCRKDNNIKSYFVMIEQVIGNFHIL